MEEEKEEEMSFTVKGMCKHGELMHRRKTSEAALRKARELAKAGCYNLHIITPEGRDYDSSEFGDLPRPRRKPTYSEDAPPHGRVTSAFSEIEAERRQSRIDREHSLMQVSASNHFFGQKVRRMNVLPCLSGLTTRQTRTYLNDPAL